MILITLCSNMFSILVVLWWIKIKTCMIIFLHHLILYFNIYNEFATAWPTPATPAHLAWLGRRRTDQREKDKKRKHARNANNGQVIRINIKTHSFSFRPSRQFERTCFLTSNLSGTLCPTWSRRKRSRRCPGTDGKTLYWRRRRHKIHF